MDSKQYWAHDVRWCLVSNFPLSLLPINNNMRFTDFHEEEILDVPTMTPEELADLHGVDLDMIMLQLRLGTMVELEHTRDKAMAREIALDHLKELPDYYSRLQKMEKG